MEKNRWKNYGLWASIVAFIPLLLSGFGIDIIPNYEEITNAFLGILVLSGIVSNPTTSQRWFKDDTKTSEPTETPSEDPNV